MDGLFVSLLSPQRRCRCQDLELEFGVRAARALDTELQFQIDRCYLKLKPITFGLFDGIRVRP